MKVVLEVHIIMMAKTFDEKPGAQRDIVQRCPLTFTSVSLQFHHDTKLA